jgi:phage-related protein
MGYKIEYFQAEGGDLTTVDFLTGLPIKVRAKIAKWVQLLQEEGPDLKRPYADMLRDGIRELRVSFGHLDIRLLYFIEGTVIVITHGFLKKTWQTPFTEIEKAKKCRAEWQEMSGL